MKNRLSRMFGILASARFYPPIQKRLNKLFVRFFSIDLADFASVDSYSSIQSLFTRSLKTERQFSGDTTDIISPTDSTIAQFGKLNSNTILQVKGLPYDLQTFVTKSADTQLVEAIKDGAFINFYLSPKDYHHFHAPIDFSIRKIIHVPGTLYPVKKTVLNSLPNLYIKNERVILEGTLNNGRAFYFVAIGAFNVGKITINSEPRLQTNNKKVTSVRCYDYPDPIKISKGEDLGHFEMGSSVVLLFAKNSVEFTDGLKLDRTISFGDNIAKLK